MRVYTTIYTGKGSENNRSEKQEGQDILIRVVLSLLLL